MLRESRMRLLLALLAAPLFVRCFRRVGLRAAVVLAALGLFALTGCAEIVGFGDHAIEPACGDGAIGVGEGCDDANGAAGDGCSACSVDEGFTCVGAPSVCSAVCGDGARAGLVEECDDGNKAGGDGCSAACAVEAGYVCVGSPSECSTSCGDGTVAPGEGCDDGNTGGGDGCSGVCSVEKGFTCGGSPSSCEEVCGDGLVVGDEGCDDQGVSSGDGCSSMCAKEPGYSCSGEPSECLEVCGDGLVVGAEGCDDQNLISGDGCSSVCAKEPGFLCSGAPSECLEVCGDGLVVGAEGCDDQNLISGDGCSSACAEEAGFSCSGEPSICPSVCGDGLVVGLEGCDDQNLSAGDGCDACAVEPGFSCSGAPSTCDPICGDGLLRGGEACDDVNVVSFDGCSSACLVEVGYKCSGEPSICKSVCGDGVLAVGAEQCDDGATMPNDCCSSTCKLEAAGCEVEPNNTSGQANDFVALSVGGAMKAVIKPSTDIDIFRLTVPPSGVGDLLAETLDGPFGSTCASNAIDTKISIRNGMGVVLASDDDAGPGLCSVASLTGLPPGDYFVEVIDSPAGGALSFDYSLKITFKVALCGNGIKEGLEQCDDGNTMSGDGCSPVCLFEMESEDEAGGNNSCADSSGPYSPPVIIAGAITPIGDLDYFAFTVPAVADVRVETFGPAGPGACAAPIDTLVELRGQDCTSVLAADNDDGLGACSLINPAVDVAARHLPPGTYFVRVEELGNNAEIVPGYSAYITFVALCGNGVKEGSEECDAASLPTATCDASCERIPVCGDLFLDAPETCDDGNTANGDGCSAACVVEGVVAEAEPNGTIGEAMASAVVITGDTFVTGSVGVIGDKDIFKLVLAQAAVVRLETFDSSFIDCAGGIATTLRLFSPGGAQLYTNDLSGIGGCSALVVRLAAGTYYAQVEELGNNAVVPGYALEVDFQADIGAEVEGNDGTLNATPVAGSDVVILGNHQVNADADYFAVMVPESWSIRAEVIEGSLVETCESNGIDSHLTLFDPSGVPVVSADDGGRGFCSLLDGTGSAPLYSGAHGLAAGTYYLRVQASQFAQGSAAGQFDYRLAVTLRAP